MALITNTDTSILPYNDDEMVYDIDRQMYILTNVGVNRLIGVNLIEIAGSETQANLIRYEVSQDVYNYIRGVTRLGQMNYKIYQIAKDENTRQDFKLVLVEQMRYYIRSGAGLLKDQHGVNIEKGKSINLNSLRGQVLISRGAEMLLYQLGLLFSGYMYNYNIENDGTW
jgi:hypothetical protein